MLHRVLGNLWNDDLFGLLQVSLTGRSDAKLGLTWLTCFSLHRNAGVHITFVRYVTIIARLSDADVDAVQLRSCRARHSTARYTNELTEPLQ